MKRWYVLPLAAFLAVAAAYAARTPDAVSKELKQSTIESLLKDLDDHYVFPDKAAEARKSVMAKWTSNGYDEYAEGDAFAKALAADINAVLHDAHFRIHYSSETLPVRKQVDKPSTEELKQRSEMIRRSNAAFQKVERLPGNIGYIKFNLFFEPEAAKRSVAAAMKFVEDTDALIFDVRENGGGDPSTVQLICSYLFGDKPVHLNDIYTREDNETHEFWTLKKIDGKRYLDREVYVLCSKRTGSGAEEFCYDLQTQKRATIIGETTWGGANPGGDYRLNDHFAAFIPGGRAINPITKKNWEGTGVEPDIKVATADALKTAHTMALKKLIETAKDPESKSFYEGALRQVESASAPSGK